MSEFRRSNFDLSKFLSVDFAEEAVDLHNLDTTDTTSSHPKPAEHQTKQPPSASKSINTTQTPIKSSFPTNKQFICKNATCSSTFDTKKDLKKHKLSHREKKHKCDFPECKWAFFDKSKLARHMVTHTKKKEYQCPQCKAMFAQDNLKVHMRTHTGEKPFPCRVEGCGAVFSQAGNRNIHEKTHDRQTVGKKRRKRSAAEMRDFTDVSEHVPKIAKTYDLLSPEKPSIGHMDANVFTFKASTQTAGSCLNSSVVPSIHVKTVEVQDWWASTPQTELDDLDYQYLLHEHFEFDPFASATAN